jgi:ABC-type multidrug transport system fused ATPase/permease subunit
MKLWPSGKPVLTSNIFYKALSVLSISDRRKTLVVLVVQILLTALDLIGVAVVGLLGALAVSGVQSQVPGNRVFSVLEFLSLNDNSFQFQAASLAILATGILAARTLFSLLVVRKTIFFLSRRAAKLTSELTNRLLSQPLTTIESRPFQETVYTLTVGVPAILLGIISNTILITSDATLLLVMFLALMFVDPILALCTLLLFGGVGILLNKIVNTRARSLGSRQTELTIKSNSKIIEILSSYRELVVRNRREYYVKEIGAVRFDISSILGEMTFMPNISKYVIELTLIVGALFISAIQFLLNDASNAVATLSVFLAAGTRIVPAMLRIQQSLITVKGNIGIAGPAIEMLENLTLSSVSDSSRVVVETSHQGFVPEIVMKKVSYTYPNAEKASVLNVSIEIPPGATIALVGSSGAGKTTLIDVLLGVLPASSGQVLISGLEPIETFSTWPGAVAYVPQNVFIANSTIKENILLGYSDSMVQEALIWDALDMADLSNFVKSLPRGLDTAVGENGSNLSGGQRQRLGIARALLTKPKFVVLDEATSSLDGESEAAITETFLNLPGETTLITIAHRLSTVRNADKVVYMSNGAIQAVGTFDEVRSVIDDFDSQARLMGL